MASPRGYQKYGIDNSGSHTADDRVHLVATGSGKTARYAGAKAKEVYNASLAMPMMLHVLLQSWT
jgi:hypothetical protein